MASSAPIPKELSGDALFARDMPEDRLLRFWDAQIASLEKLFASREPSKKEWDARIHPELRLAAEKFRTTALSQLMNQHRMSGSRWIDQFAHGFPITGHLSQRFVYESDGGNHFRISRSDLFRAAAKRFRERATKSGMKNAHRLCGETLQQAEKGSLLPPPPHGSGRGAH